jgi:DNA topoisomerase-1
MRNRHVKVSGARIEFQFRGKSGKFHRIAIDDPELARVIRRIRDLPGRSCSSTSTTRARCSRSARPT